jgi:hypothetical protein
MKLRIILILIALFVVIRESNFDSIRGDPAAFCAELTFLI